jgi:hypothetical protein
MSTPDSPNKPSGSSHTAATLAGLAGAGLFMLLVGICLISAVTLEQMRFGWIYFPLRVLPLVSVDRPTALLGAVSAIAFMVLMHLTMRWLMSREASGDGRSLPHWTFRATVTTSCGIVLLFASGTAMVGATHQFIWLLTGHTTSGPARRALPQVYGVVASAREAARRSQQKNNLKQISIAVQNLQETYNSLPPGGTINERGRLMHGWAIYLGNYMSFTNSGVDFRRPWNEPPNDRLYHCAIPEFLNPSLSQVFDGEGYGLSHVAGNVHVLPITTVPSSDTKSPFHVFAATERDAVWQYRNRPLRMIDITDGTTNTILIGEVAGNFKPWGHPANVRDPAVGVNQSADGFGGPPGTNDTLFTMCDGYALHHVRWFGAHDQQSDRSASTAGVGDSRGGRRCFRGKVAQAHWAVIRRM